MLKGWRTVLWGLFVAITPVALTYLAGVDWTKYLSPTWALYVTGMIVILLRVVTTTPVFKK